MQIRATNPEDKELRREAILDAAEQLWLSQPERMANVADIATAAGLAKGTVYLYFRSKEELFLAIHERHVANYFNRVINRAQQDEPMQMDDMFAFTRQFLAETPAFLPLATQCHGMMERHIPLEVGYAFEERTYARLNAVVSRPATPFPADDPSPDAAKLRADPRLVAIDAPYPAERIDERTLAHLRLHR